MSNTQKSGQNTAGNFTQLGSLFEEYTLVDKGGYITQEFQDYGYRLAIDLGDMKHKALYIKMAKEVDRTILDAALRFVSDATHAKSKAKLFMWKVKQLKNEKKMRNNIKLGVFILLLSIVVGLVGYNYFYTPFAQLPQEDSASDSSQLTTSYPLVNEMAPSTPETATAEERALQNMSQREKVLLLIATPLSVGEPLQIEDVLAWLETNPTGMVTLFGSDVSVDEAGEVVSQVQTTYTTAVFSPIIAVDHEGGSVQRLSGKGFTTLPSWFAVCEIENPQERQELLASSAAELREVGVSMVFAPVVDTRVNGSPLGNRACSADQAIITRRAQEFITAFENKGVVSVIKHFPNIGKVNQDLHVSYGSTDVSPDEMIAFENLTKQNDMLGIMVSHAGLESIDSTLPCAQNIECVALARSNKDNLIVSDALEMAAALGAGDQTTTQAAIDTLKAGVDVIVLEKGASSESLEELVVSITAAVEQDSVLQSNIDAAALRVLHYSTFAQ